MSQRKKHVVRVAVLGDVGVGKTQLLNRFLNNKFRGVHSSTIGPDFVTSKAYTINDSSVTMQIWDTPGKFYKSGLYSYLKGTVLCVLVFDITDQRSFESLRTYIDTFLAKLSPKNADTFPFVVIGNKSDLASRCQVSIYEARQWCASESITYFETSAKTGSNVDEAFQTIAATLATELTKKRTINPLHMQKDLAKSTESKDVQDETQSDDQSLLNCGVCFEGFSSQSDAQTPRILLCGHSFCTKCLNGLLMKKQIMCPTCRQMTPVGNGIHGCKTNFALIELLDVIQEFEGGTKCDQCDGKSASLWCSDCGGTMCIGCSETLHFMKILRHHKPVALKNKSSSYCQVHERENLSFICLDCKTPICNICRDPEYGYHGKHKVNLIAREAGATKKKLQDCQTELKSAVGELESLSKTVANAVTTVNSNIAKTRDDIRNDFARVIALVEKRRNDMLSDLSREGTLALSKLQKQRSSVGLLLSQYAAFSGECKHAMDLQGVAGVQNSYQVLAKVEKANKSKQILQPEPDVDPNVQYSMNLKNLKELLPNLGSLSLGMSYAIKVEITRCVAKTYESLTLAWEVADIRKAQNVKKYILQFRPALEKKSQWVDVTETSATFSKIDGLQPETSYLFRVCTLSHSLAKRIWSSEKSCKTPKESIFTFDQTRSDKMIDLSKNSRVAKNTSIDDSWRVGLCKEQISSGIVSCDMRIDDVGGGENTWRFGTGVAKADHSNLNTSSFPGGASYIALTGNYHLGIKQGTCKTYTTGDVVTVQLDFMNEEIEFKLNGNRQIVIKTQLKGSYRFGFLSSGPGAKITLL